LIEFWARGEEVVGVAFLIFFWLFWILNHPLFRLVF
jgi:hypothetical protein